MGDPGVYIGIAIVAYFVWMCFYAIDQDRKDRENHK